MTAREWIDRIGLGNAVVGVLAAVVALLIIGAGFDFEIGEMLEVIATFGLVALALGAFAALAHVVGLLLEAIEASREER